MSKIATYIILLCLYASTAFGQGIDNPGDTIYVEFRIASRKLDKPAKATLDSLAKLLSLNTNLGVKLISSTKDLCGDCGALAWRRTASVQKYLASKAPNNNNYSSIALLYGEFNRIAILMGTWIPAAELAQPHPNLRRKTN
jgi:hypothetical protein